MNINKGLLIKILILILLDDLINYYNYNINEFKLDQDIF